MNDPHGAKRLVDQYVGKLPKNAPSLTIGERALCDLHNIASGVFTPLTGFMDKKTFDSVLDSNRLPSKAVWTVPIVLDATAAQAQNLRAGREVLLCDARGRAHGTLEIGSIYPHDKKRHARQVFGTLDPSHPGAHAVLSMGEYLVSGEIRAVRPTRRAAHALEPRQTREIFARRGFKTVAGFQTRNILHRAHEYLQRAALEQVDGLFIHPLVGWKKIGDYRPEVITSLYPKFIRDFYPQDSVVFGVLNTAMRYAGPKEAAFHAIIRKNFGCTHFIVGRDHAGVGGFYGAYAAQEFVASLGDFGIEILAFKEPIYCRRCRMIVTEKTCGHGRADLEPISGTLIRRCLVSGKKPPEKFLRPEIFKELLKLGRKGELFHA